MIKCVIFDLDGTLLDTTEGVLEAVKHTVDNAGLSCAKDTDWRSFIGPPIQKSFVEHFGCSLETAQELADDFRDYYKSRSLYKAEPYAGIYDLCGLLKERNYKLCVATYKREDYAVALLNYFGFNRYFDVIHGADNNNILSKSDIIELCIKETEMPKYSCVYIGDTKSDRDGAIMAKVGFIGVTYGFGFGHMSEIDSGIFVDKPIEIIDKIRLMDEEN